MISQCDRDISQALAAQDLLTDDQFDLIRDIAKRHAGIAIADFKKAMVSRRVRTRLKALSIDIFEDYFRVLRGARRQQELQFLINALTTNKTEFFREAHHFRHLGQEAQQLLEKLRGRPHRRFRIWSAGCSTGEEPYSIAMTLNSAFGPQAGVDFRVLATDIDTNVLARASVGHYHLSDLASVPMSHRELYFKSNPARPNEFRIVPQIKDRIWFKPLNLIEGWPMKGPFDVIFCRNVVIYFDKLTQIRLFDRLADILVMDGLLYCGHSESLHGVSDRFKAIGQSIYQRIA